MSRRLFLFFAVLLLPVTGHAQPIDDTSLDDLPPPSLEDDAEEGDGEEEVDPDPFGFGEEFSLEARDRVISAARTETTIQEAPAIVTVITRQEIEDRGFRTIVELMQSIPGFEGDRSEGNHWITEAFARGNPRTVLVLVNGINVVEPTRNMIVLDRKIPLEIVDRIEIISGPGGVLWGSNALLGVVNITTITGRDNQGWAVRLGGGHGPGDLGAGEANLRFGHELFEDVYLLANLNFYSSRGAELTVDSQKLVGVLPAPAPDGLSLFLSDPVTTDPSRDYFGSIYLNLRGGPITFNAFIGMERDHRQLGFGGGVLTTDQRSSELVDAVGAVDVETVGQDPLWLFSLQYRDRFLNDDFGFSANTYFLRWMVKEDPFGSFPPSDLLPRGLATVFFDDGQYRAGLNLDADYLLPENNHLIFGAEFFADLLSSVKQTFPEDPFDAENDATFTDTLVNPVERLIGAFYIADEWKASESVALNAGARLQMSNTYDPATLLAGALVWNVFGKTFLKLNYTEGFRPPDFQSTNVNSDIRSGITFNANPNLTVERSQAVETEINTVLMEDTRAIDRWYLRADYSFTVLDDIIENTATGFENSGTRFIHSAEVLSRLTFVGSHELSLAYYFVDSQDDDTGPVRNIANHIVNANGRIQLVPDLLHFSTDLTWLGPREDANRRVDEPEVEGGMVNVFASDVVIDELESVWLLRAGFRADNIADRYAFSVFGYNILNEDYAIPDPFFDDRVATRPFPMPGWSVFATAEAEF